jgi:uncharacterized protein involved in exopolysaccharide biosynthesis
MYMPENTKDDEIMLIKKFLAIFLRNKWLFVFSILVCLILGIVYYKAESPL